jgi:hypothetical protein
MSWLYPSQSSKNVHKWAKFIYPAWIFLSTPPISLDPQIFNFVLKIYFGKCFQFRLYTTFLYFSLFQKHFPKFISENILCCVSYYGKYNPREFEKPRIWDQKHLFCVLTCFSKHYQSKTQIFTQIFNFLSKLNQR